MNQNSAHEFFVKAAKEPEADPDETVLNVKPTDDEKELVTETLKKFFRRQAQSVLPKLGAKSATWWDAVRWDKELADDLEPIMREIAANHGKEMAEALGTDFSVEAIVNYIRKAAESRAKAINEKTLEKLTEALRRAQEAEGQEAEEEAPEEEPEESPAEHEFGQRMGPEAIGLGLIVTKWLSWWGTREAYEQGKRQGLKKQVQKRWRTGPNARPTHAAMDGQTVDIDEKFSNGADWPGDDNLEPEESCRCNCTTDVIIE